MKNILDPNKTKAILIGTTKFVDFNDIEAVENNLTEFAKVLADKNIFGLLRKENIKIIKDQTNEDVELKLIEYTENAKAEGINTLIIYFAGHGFRNREGKYFLATKNSRKKLIRTSGNSALAYDAVKQIIKSSNIAQTIVFIDACYSGSVTQGEGNNIFKEYQVKGTYTLTSSDSTELSYFDSDENYTIFTGELLNILKNGLSNTEKEKVSLDELYKELQTSVKKKNPKMSPQQLVSREIRANNFLFFKNKSYDENALIQKHIQEQINEADNLYKHLELDKAELIYIRLKDKIHMVNIDFDRDIIQELEEKINKCRDLTKQKETFEEHYHTIPKKVIDTSITKKPNIFSIAIITILVITIVLIIWKPWNNETNNLPINNDTIVETETSKEEIIKHEYPKTENGISWTDEKYGTFIDERDNHKYKVVKISEQVWMAENLNYTKNIPHITDDKKWENLEDNNTDMAWCYYDNKSENGKIYGALYTYAAALKVAPKGWHLPTKEEFETLLYNCGGVGTQAFKTLIKGGKSDINILLSGWRNYNGNFNDVSDITSFWAVTQYSTYAYNCNLNTSGKYAYMAYMGNRSKRVGSSVRLLRD